MKEFKPRLIELIPSTEFKVLKIIRIEGPKYSPFAGYLPYLRNLTQEYNDKTNDSLDEVILNTIKQNLPDSYLTKSRNIVFKGELEDDLTAIEGGSKKNITIQFNPLIPTEDFAKLVGKTFHAYPVKFKARMLFSEGSDKKHYLNDYLMCSLPTPDLEQLLKTIQVI